uniref:Uncharacterized protein n=1 Tax=Romanomermis culicivorax TaxID=13658 RepID=A0A915JPA2_ROMCU
SNTAVVAKGQRSRCHHLLTSSERKTFRGILQTAITVIDGCFAGEDEIFTFYHGPRKFRNISN